MGEVGAGCAVGLVKKVWWLGPPGGECADGRGLPQPPELVIVMGLMRLLVRMLGL